MSNIISRTIRSSVGRNVLFLGISGAAKGLSTIAFVLLAVATLESRDAGQVILAFLIIRIAQNIAGAGLSRYLARETANDPDATASLTLDVLKLLAAVLPVGLAVALALFLVEPELGVAAGLASVAAVAGSMQQSAAGSFLGRERTHLDSVTEATVAVVLVSGVVIAALLDSGPVGYIAAIAASRLAGAAVALVLLALNFRPWPSLTQASATRAFKEGLPYMVNTGSSFIFLRADILLLGAISGTHAVTVYGGVADPLVTLSATVHIVNTAFLPGLSASDADRRRLAGRMLGIDLLLGCSLAVLVLLLAGPVTDRFLDENAETSANVLRVLSLGLVLRFVNNGLATWLTASGRQWRRTAIAITAGVFNLSANLVTIPIWGYWAAVFVTIATEGLILALAACALRPEWYGKPLAGIGKPVGNAVVEGYNLGPK
jgi:O-antigen/teichoic acid export membrane protein